MDVVVTPDVRLSITMLPAEKPPTQDRDTSVNMEAAGDATVGEDGKTALSCSRVPSAPVPLATVFVSEIWPDNCSPWSTHCPPPE